MAKTRTMPACPKGLMAECGSSKWAGFMRLPTKCNDDEYRLDGIWKRLGIVGEERPSTTRLSGVFFSRPI